MDGARTKWLSLSIFTDTRPQGAKGDQRGRTGTYLHPVYAALCEAEERVTVTSRSFEAHFPSPDRFVYLTLYGAVAFLPEFNWDDEALRQLSIKTVTREIEPVLAQYRQGNRLRFPVFWHVAAAHA